MHRLCKPYLFTPLRTPVTPSEQKYNKCQIRTRNIIERTFGIWKRKFPCLRRSLANAPGTTVNIILSCALLHNISRKYNQYTTDSDKEEEDGEVAGEIDHSPQCTRNCDKSSLYHKAFQLKKKIINYIYPWYLRIHLFINSSEYKN